MFLRMLEIKTKATRLRFCSAVVCIDDFGGYFAPSVHLELVQFGPGHFTHDHRRAKPCRTKIFMIRNLVELSGAFV